MELEIPSPPNTSIRTAKVATIGQERRLPSSRRAAVSVPLTVRSTPASSCLASQASGANRYLTPHGTTNTWCAAWSSATEKVLCVWRCKDTAFPWWSLTSCTPGIEIRCITRHEDYGAGEVSHGDRRATRG